MSDIGREGRAAIGRSDSYSIDYLIGDTLPRTSRDATAVEVLDEERENWRRAAASFKQMTGEDFPVPVSKPYARPSLPRPARAVAGMRRALDTPPD